MLCVAWTGTRRIPAQTASYSRLLLRRKCVTSSGNYFFRRNNSGSTNIVKTPFTALTTVR
jgi:hypothetical protein